MFSVRLVTADSYQALPLIPFDLATSEFRNSRIKNVPTIRVFGSTLSGEKVCLHIHGVFPYIYVPYVGRNNPEDFAHRLAKSLDDVINVSLGSAGADTQHVYKIHQVKGVPYYGYHEKVHHYFKIYFYNPAMIKRAADLLQNGLVLNQTLQPHEAHIPFILQFMIDYNIYGMSLINLKDVKYRQANRRGPDGKLNNQTLTPHYKTRDYLPPTVKKQSTCEIEVDAWASDILNKEAIEKGLDVNPGLAAIWDEERARRVLAGFEGGDSQLEPPSSPLRTNLLPTDNDLLQLERFQRKLVHISQNEESPVSINSDSSIYPVEVNEGLNLLDASHLERHIGPKNDKNGATVNDLSTSSGEHISLHFDQSAEELHVNLEGVRSKPIFKPLQLSGEESSFSPNRTLDQSIFDLEDVPLVDILEQLAEGHKTDEHVDDDSILGSHCSMGEYKSEEEEVKNDVPDLNLTSLEIDNLSLNLDLSPQMFSSGKSKSSDQKNPGTSFSLHALPFENKADEGSQQSDEDSRNSFIIPQFDGADDLLRKRSTSAERSSSIKRRKLGSKNENIPTQVLSDLNKKIDTVYSSNESISEILDSELDRTLIPEENFIDTISETSESTGNRSGSADKDLSVVVEEKLICNNKSDKTNEVIVCNVERGNKKEPLNNHKRKLTTSSLWQSPKRGSKSPTKLLKSPSKLLKSPSRRSPRKSLRSPRKSLQHPRRSYSSLNIIITPSKHGKGLEKRSHGISQDDESSGDAPENVTAYFTQKRVTENTSKTETCDLKVDKKLQFYKKGCVAKNSFGISEDVGTSKKPVSSQKSEDSGEDLFLSQKSQVKQYSENEKYADLSPDLKFLDSPQPRSEKHCDDDKNDQLPFSQKSLRKKCSSGEFKMNDFHNIKLSSQTSKDEKDLENKVGRNRLFSSQKSQGKKYSEKDKLSKDPPSDENLILSQNLSNEKYLADDESSKGSLLEMPLTQKSTSKESSQDGTNSLSQIFNLDNSPKEMDLLDGIDNISPLVENDKIYDEKTDSSDFEENLEILLKNIPSDSEDKDFLSKSSKFTERIIEEEQNTSSDDTLKAEDDNDYNLDITEEINNEVCDPKNLLTVTFTEFTNAELSSSYNIARKSISSLRPNRLVAITTKFSAPTRQHILDTINIYGIPTFRNQGHFYSNRNDIRQYKDATHQIINKTEASEFPHFKSQIGGVVGIKLWRRMKVNEFHSSSIKLNSVNIKRGLAERRLITITPLNLPPDRKSIVKWIKSRKRLKRKQGVKMEEAKFSSEKGDQNGDIKEINKNQKENGDQKVNEEEKKNEKEDIGKSDNSASSIKLSPFDSLPGSKELSDDSVKKSRESFGNNSSLYSTLRPSELFTMEIRKGKELRGVSFGQVDFSMDETKSDSDIANQNLQNAKAITTYQYLTILCLEVHITTRKDFLPDPQQDRIEAAFYAIHNDVPPASNVKRLEQGAIIVDLEESRNLHGLFPSCKIKYVTCEEDLFCNIISLIGECNPDILIGWELETLSWGYIFKRAGHLGTNLASTISRIPGSKCSWESHALDLEALESEIKLPGRIVLDIWRIMRHEIALLSYTFQNVMFHVMHKRLHCPSFKTLTEWWHSKVPCLRWRVLDFYINKNLGVFELLEQLDIIGRTCEHARLFGIQFYEVFSRGSQFRVESMMLRLAKPLNYILVSPSVRQRAAMRAPQSLPLILEPISTFYSDPVVVLDFQSLYPSIIIAYNYCFSTCLGRVEYLGQRDPFEFGCTTLKVTKKTALQLQGKINFSPVGIGFVKPEIRKGVLPRMLNEILNTRLMVKKAMKDNSKDDRPLQQVLHNRQLGLKLIANVTYGYTSANFSGRMPCIEVGDSIVSKGKETLQRAIKMVEDTPKWGARVVYGDTDSLFILLYGKSKAEAFKIGTEIADAVTAANPTPVKLKFEKVLYPCILQTKKRYCGYSYETIDNEKPEYLAKGIETVRRDGCPASAKILEKTLKILFNTKDLSQVKQYVTRQLDKIFRGTVSIQDLTFAREFRGLRGYSKNACVPALELTRRLMKKDPRAVPRTNERVPYIIVAGAPNEALIHSVRSPSELLADPSLRPNSIYYITRVVIPPLNRCLNLLGADVNIWFRDMPHREVLNKAVSLFTDRQKTTISQFFSAHVCLSCGNTSESSICKQCVEQPCRTIIILHEKLRNLEKNVFNIDVICRSCTGQLGIPGCESLDCPVTYRRSQVEREHALVPTISEIIDKWES